MRGFQLGTMKDSVAEHHVPHRPHRDHPPVMSVGDIDPTQDLLLHIRFPIAVAILHEDQPRLMGNNHPVLMKGQAIGNGQVVGKHRGLVRPPITVGIFQDDDLVAGFASGVEVRIGG